MYQAGVRCFYTFCLISKLHDKSEYISVFERADDNTVEYTLEQAKIFQNSLQIPIFTTRNLTDLLKAKGCGSSTI